MLDLSENFYKSLDRAKKNIFLRISRKIKIANILQKI